MKTKDFYDRLAPYYKYIYKDWESSVVNQDNILDEIIQNIFSETGQHILDAACGIGTQSIGLAQLGYNITASDLSTAAVDIARTVATERNLSIKFKVADIRQLWEIHQQEFDVVLACDNAIPHFLNDVEILQAFQQFYKCTRKGGGCIISVRDYSQLTNRTRQFYPRQVHKTPTGKLILIDIWDFEDDIYEITTYIIEDNGEEVAQTQVIKGGRYYCVEIPTLERLLTQAGFSDVITIKDKFFQPVILGHKR